MRLRTLLARRRAPLIPETPAEIALRDRRYAIEAAKAGTTDPLEVKHLEHVGVELPGAHLTRPGVRDLASRELASVARRAGR